MSIKLAHVSDCHIGVGYPGPNPFSRFQDIENILTWTADRIIAEKCDVCLIAGDLFKDAKVMLDRASQEIASIVRFLRKLSRSGISVIVISGTPSHDAIPAYELIREMQIDLVTVITKPSSFLAPFTAHPDYQVSLACLPGLNRSMLMTNDEYKGLPPEQVHRIMTDKITQICIGMAAQMPQDKPKILMAHMTYQGADTGFADLLMQHEPILTKEAVSGFDLVCLGHIHRPQVVDGKAFYSGPIERLSFNDESITPGFWTHEIDSDPSRHPMGCYQFIETPARRYVTLSFDEGSIEGLSQHGMHYFGSSIAGNLQDAIVRLRYSCSEEVAKQLSRKQLEQALYDAGAFYVSEIKADIAREDRARDSTIKESLTVGQALEKWCANQGISKEEVAELSMMTEELMLKEG